MCGIFGIVFSEDRPEIGKILIDAGKRLTYRGYDSVGMAVIKKDSKEIDLRKDVGTVDEVAEKYRIKDMGGVRGIVQLRWATFGTPAKENAQPHIDCTGKMVGAHNGNIVNTVQLREHFLNEGHDVKGWNDGEMVVHSIEEMMDGNFSKEGIRQAIIRSNQQLKGDYAFTLTHIRENIMYAAKKGSSLYLGIGAGFVCTSSDLPSIIPLTRKIVYLKDGEFVEFDHNSYRIFDINTMEEIQREPVVSDLGVNDVWKGEFPHFMLKEIHEQPETVRNMLDLLESSVYVDKFLNILEGADHIYFVASGSSYNAAVNGAYFFNKLAHKVVIPVIAGQFIEAYGNSLTEKTALVCISQSGETKDVINVVNYAKEKGKGHILSIVNVLGSTLMNQSEVYLPLASNLEISVPATKTFLNQVVMLLYLAYRAGLSSLKNRTDTMAGNNLMESKMSSTNKMVMPDPENMHAAIMSLPSLIRQTIESTENQCREIGEGLSGHKDIYSLGYGVCHGTALEGALKIKEITYAHCEGMYSSEFKHGPLSIVDKGYPVIYSTVPQDAGMIVSHMNEVACRNGRVIVISEEHENIGRNASDRIWVPTTGNPFITAILNVIPLQLIAYYWSVKVGNDPDFPRNLSKTLTVD